MMRFNLLYPMVVLLALAFLWAYSQDNRQIISWYGFIESKEMEINYNHAIAVDRILVRPGEKVKQGDTLLIVSRRMDKAYMDEESFRIAEIKAASDLWRLEQNNKITILENKRDNDVVEIDQSLSTLLNKRTYQLKLAEQLSSIGDSDGAFDPLNDKIEELRSERLSIIQSCEVQVQATRKEINEARNPYRTEIQRLEAEIAFKKDRQVQTIPIQAYADGIVGNIYCREGEFFPSYKTLLSLYDPYAMLVRGYVHEDLSLSLDTSSFLTVRSLKNESTEYEGRVIGLGSRIVEIPGRLRKIQDVKTYGREVLVQIPSGNYFLQKEKVALSLDHE